MRNFVFSMMCATALALGGGANAEELRVGLAAAPLDLEMALYENFFGMLGKYTGDTYRIVHVEHEDKISALMRGQIDIAMAVVANPKSNASVLYGEPYSTTEMSVLLVKDKVGSLKELKGRVACVTYYSQASAAESFGATAEYHPRWSNKFKALQEGRCDASFGYRLGHEIFLRQAPEASKRYKHEKGVWSKSKIELTYAVAKTNRSLLGKLDRAVAKSKRNGDFDAMIWRCMNGS